MIRSTFLEASRIARDLVAAPEVVEAWDQPSALADLSVRGLAGHLTRATTLVEACLDRGEPEGEPISPARYFNTALADPSVDVGVRQKGEETAAVGHIALLATLDATLARLATRLEAEPADRKVAVFLDMVLTVDDYLATRLVELAVHVDDLAVSVGLPTPAMPLDTAVATLVEVARDRHGDLAVLRALSRRERAAPTTLVVF